MINGSDNINYNSMNGRFDLNVDNVNTSSITYDDDDVINIDTDTTSLNIYGKKTIDLGRSIHLYDDVIIENNLSIKGTTNISTSGFIYGQTPTFTVLSNFTDYNSLPEVTIDNYNLKNPILNFTLPRVPEFSVGNVWTISGPAYIQTRNLNNNINLIAYDFGMPCPYLSVFANTISSYIASVNIDNSNMYYPQMTFTIPRGL